MSAALAQITVALYRALAREAAESFRLQVIRAWPAPAGGAAPQPDLLAKKLELAALLTLELDNGSTAGVLRGFWRKLDRLKPGILWPANWDSVRPDQGMREIIAIATASQAFQVCIGAIDAKTTATNADTAKQEKKSGFTVEAAPALNRLAGLLGGAALGAGLVREDPAGSGRFMFLLDRFCSPPVAPPAKAPADAAVAAPAAIAAERSREENLIEAARALVGDPAVQGDVGALESLMLTVPYLREIGVLDFTVPDEVSMRDALASLVSSSSIAVAPDSPPMALIEHFVNSCAQAAPYMALAGLITRTVADTAKILADLRPSVELKPYSDENVRAGIARHLRIPEAPASPMPLTCEDVSSRVNIRIDLDQPQLALPEMPRLDAAAVRSWRAWPLPRIRIEKADFDDDPWPFWRYSSLRGLSAVYDFTDRPRPTSGGIPFTELVLSARGALPGALFRQAVWAMTALEWSDVAIAAIGGGEVPGWALVAALRALRFGPAIRQTAIDALSLMSATTEDRKAMLEFAVPGLQNEEEPHTHFLYVVESSGRTLADEPPWRVRQAVFAIRRADLRPGGPQVVARLIEFLDSVTKLHYCVL